MGVFRLARGLLHRAVLFNTLDYAGFLALVFVATWLLLQRRFALLLPWFALAGYALAHPTPLAGAFCVGHALLSAALIRGTDAQRTPSKSFALISVASAMGALTPLTLQDQHLDPYSYGLSLLKVPVESLGPAHFVLGALGFWLSYLLIRAKKVRLLCILVASYIFYAHWDFRFLPLIWGSSTIDWLLARKIGNTQDPYQRRLWLSGTIALNLGVLGFFKYFNFGVDSVATLAAAWGFSAPEVVLQVALPVGISFFTFESMSYVIDVYRKELSPHKSYTEYLAFVAFFPHLVAGPIVRPRDLLPQLAQVRRFSAPETSEGLFLIALGLSKKILIGDYLALNLVDRVFDAPLMYSALEVYAAVVGYALQIYCDFSGYTDIAIGSALLLGVRFPLNFNSPYKAYNVVDFWRRWHISLSTWLRDYLYIPLGGNRKGRGRTYFNLMATMVLGGLWHGAAWTFVLWGFLHGAALALNKWWQEWRATRQSQGAHSRHTPARSQLTARFVSVFLTFHFVCVCWVFFRAESFPKAQLIFQQLASLTTYHPNLPASVVAVLTLGAVFHYVPDRWFEFARRNFVSAPWPLQGILLCVTAILLRKMASQDAVPFVYFQF